MESLSTSHQLVDEFRTQRLAHNWPKIFSSSKPRFGTPGITCTRCAKLSKLETQCCTSQTRACPHCTTQIRPSLHSAVDILWLIPAQLTILERKRQKRRDAKTRKAVTIRMQRAGHECVSPSVRVTHSSTNSDRLATCEQISSLPSLEFIPF